MVGSTRNQSRTRAQPQFRHPRPIISSTRRVTHLERLTLAPPPGEGASSRRTTTAACLPLPPRPGTAGAHPHCTTAASPPPPGERRATREG